MKFPIFPDRYKADGRRTLCVSCSSADPAKPTFVQRVTTKIAKAKGAPVTVFARRELSTMNLKEDSLMRTSLVFSMTFAVLTLLSASKASASEPCCGIASIDARKGLVVGKETATGRTFEFTVKDAAVLKGLRVGQPLIVDFPGKSVTVGSRKFALTRVNLTETYTSGRTPPPPPAGPDLIVDQGTSGSMCSLKDCTQCPYETHPIYIKNVGNVSVSKQITVTVKHGSEIIQTWTANAPAAGQRVKVGQYTNFPWNCPPIQWACAPSANNFFITVDTTNAVAETNEQNNTRGWCERFPEKTSFQAAH